MPTQQQAAVVCGDFGNNHVNTSADIQENGTVNICLAIKCPSINGINQIMWLMGKQSITIFSRPQCWQLFLKMTNSLPVPCFITDKKFVLSHIQLQCFQQKSKNDRFYFLYRNQWIISHLSYYTNHILLQ